MSKNCNDSICLRNNIDKLQSWCQCSKLSLNIKKCLVMSFSRTHENILACYLDDQLLSLVDSTRDLVIIDTKPNSNKDIDYIIKT